MIDLKPVVPKSKLKTAKDVAKELFGYTVISDDADRIMSEIQQETKRLLNRFRELKSEYYDKAKYPGKEIVQNGISVLYELSRQDNTLDFFNYVADNEDELEELGSDYAPIKEFFEGEQRKIFENALKKLKIYEDSRVYIVDSDLESIVKQMQNIVSVKAPYGMIRQLPDLISKFDDKYLVILEEKTEPVRKAILDNKSQVMDHLAGKPYAKVKEALYANEFQRLLDKAESSNDVSRLRSLGDQSDALKERLINEMHELDEKCAPKPEPPANGGANSGEKPVKPVTPKKEVVNTFLKHVVHTTSWHIESEADIDKYCEQLKRQLKENMREGLIYNIKF